MKGKSIVLATLVLSLSLTAGCSWLGFGGDPEPEPTPVVEPAPPVVAEPTPPPAPVKPMTAKERKKAEADAKKKAKEEQAAQKKAEAEAKKQAAADRKAGRPAQIDPPDVAQAKLDVFAKSHVMRANETLRPNRTHVSVRREGAQYVAWFSEVDTVTLKTELYPSNTPGCQYVGHVVYIENIIASYGKTEKEARSGVFKQIKSKRVRELTRYDKGAWIY